MKHLSFDRPASNWAEALPIGNGRLGAMIFGNPVNERIQLNEDSIWYGGPIDRVNPDSAEALAAIRSLILSGHISEAEKQMSRCLSGTPQSQRSYQSAGDLQLFHEGLPEIAADYQRILNLNAGLVQVGFSNAGIYYKREYLASFPAQVITVHLTASKPGRISFSLLMTRGRFYDHSGKASADTIFLDGSLGTGGNDFILAAKASALGGKVYTQGEFLCVEGADEVTLYVTAETSFYHGEDFRKKAFERLETAAALGYSALKAEHQKDYRELFCRVTLTLGKAGSTVSLPEKNLIDSGPLPGPSDLPDLGKLLDFAKLPDSGNCLQSLEKQLQLAETYFQYGRYLLLSSSRPGSLPANLQGIWNESMTPAWDSKYTININTEMNYWPAELCNLSECHLPLFDLLKRMQENGKSVARRMYGCRGFVAHHNTDLWADCAPQDIYIPASYWVMGGAWLSTHIWTHYEYTKDLSFLKEMYPVLEDAVLFFHDFLIQDGKEFITCPSVSPENTYRLADGTLGCVCGGASMDSQILRDLFRDYLSASAVLNIEEDMVHKTKDLLNALPPIQIGRHGQIMEWREDYEEEEPGHRHISQLYALHPSRQITRDETPDLAAAAEKTLERRLYYGGGHTGWSCAWIINFYARLGNGEKAYENLLKLWSNSTFPNLMDTHPMGDGHVFQIDGNLGATSAIAEMLVQSNKNRILLLPALPPLWADGKVTGLKTAGGAQISLTWEEGRLLKVRLHSDHALQTMLVYKEAKKAVSLGAGEDCEINWT